MNIDKRSLRGYLVEAVDASPGQSELLRPGMIIVEIVGQPLLLAQELSLA